MSRFLTKTPESLLVDAIAVSLRRIGIVAILSLFVVHMCYDTISMFTRTFFVFAASQRRFVVERNRDAAAATAAARAEREARRSNDDDDD